MPKLLQLQKSFHHNVLQRDNENLSFISSDFPKERFDIYRQTIFENMINSLKITYPGIWKLLGDKCANSVAYAYCKIEKHLPKTGSLDDFGNQLPQFISTLSELSALPYLQSYASYEWLKHLTYNAADSQVITSLNLQNIPEKKIDNTIFHFIPSCFLFTSQYNIPDIDDLVKDRNKNPIALKCDITYYCVLSRMQYEVHTYWIKKSIWEFCKRLINGNTLAESADYAENIDSRFSLISAISFILQAQLVGKISYKGD